MGGPLPKDPALKQRRNRPSTSAELSGGKKRRVPALPKLLETVGEGEDAREVLREWHPLTRAWWRDVWRSPMADAFLASDQHGLFILARLVDAYWRNPSKELAAEIRLQRQCFGLTPIDRRRLDWKVDGDEPERKTRPSAAAELPPPAAEPIEDPRKVLRVLSA